MKNLFIILVGIVIALFNFSSCVFSDMKDDKNILTYNEKIIQLQKEEQRLQKQVETLTYGEGKTAVLTRFWSDYFGLSDVTLAHQDPKYVKILGSHNNLIMYFGGDTLKEIVLHYDSSEELPCFCRCSEWQRLSNLRKVYKLSKIDSIQSSYEPERVFYYDCVESSASTPMMGRPHDPIPAQPIFVPLTYSIRK